MTATTREENTVPNSIAPSKPVPPAYPTCRLSDVASFKPGVWNGKPHDAAFVKTLADNFRRYSSGPTAYYTPYVSINHKDELRAGRVSAARLVGDVLHLDADDVPYPVGAWRNSGGLSQPSIEYYEPVYDPAGNLIDGFRRPDGSIEPGPVLKCLTLLGADAPAVKGLPPLPVATFADRRPVRDPGRGARVRKFANAPTGVKIVNSDPTSNADRYMLLGTLQALGMDTSSVTDAVPDETLRAFVTLAQKLQNDPAGAQADASADPQTQQFAQKVQRFADHQRTTAIKAGVVKLDPARRVKLLSGSEVGRAILRKEGTRPVS